MPGLDDRIGREEVLDGGRPGAMRTATGGDGDERFAWAWAEGGKEVKWLCVPDAAHMFDTPDGGMGADAKAVEDGMLKRDSIVKMTGEWLFG